MANNYYAEIFAKGEAVAGRYNQMVERLDADESIADDDLLALARELHESCQDLGMSKAYEMSPYTHDQHARLNHVVSLLSPDRQPDWYGIGDPPTRERLEEARARLAGELS